MLMDFEAAERCSNEVLIIYYIHFAHLFRVLCAEYAGISPFTINLERK